MRKPFLAALLVTFTACAYAQRISSPPAHVSISQSPTASHSKILPSAATSNFALLRNFHNSHPRQSLLYPYGIFPELFSPDNPPPDSTTPPAQSDLLMQALTELTSLTGLNTSQAPAKSDSQSQLIELQGDHYVSLTNAKSDNASAPITIPRPSKNEPAQKPAPAELSPVTLLFRDGHREDMRDYAIAGGVIYARGNFYHDGYWNKKIDLSTIDLPETIKLNEAHGIRFALPSSPNEVVTRP